MVAVTVGRILRNKIYIGVLEQGKSKKVNYKLKKLFKNLNQMGSC